MSARQVTAGTYTSDGSAKIYKLVENQRRKELYKNAINKCCNPKCTYGRDFHVHHILPINRGGTDDFTNYIVLCSRCHRWSGLHSLGEDRRLELYTYKMYVEYLQLGFCSDDFDNEEFELKLRCFIKSD